ncbi:AzlC family ABC transporter permease [Alkalibacter saccharofermentans]|uniref:4-azaleucine resistance probable transporter AzlC n=1 Tax=Alkalibacter saccharofermentans DSM 14828 TaxID=1120975 RepID=A0A1M4Z378_9FIRM|nr:AzlC family ABC transporter permease [Alkalibacter saccharofermentans]SHF12519.1 4-azaleucine resistance probable transporter AzlC [Alkalibacter saccharofermentans DSM 14828]
MGIRQGIKSAFPVCIGYLPLAIAYGVLGRAAGLSGALIVMMSILVYAGAAQFLSINMFATGVMPLEIILTTFIINSRHLIMSASLSRRLEHGIDTLKRMVISFGITDESFSVSSLDDNYVKLPAGYLAAVGLTPYIFWIAGSILGIVFSSFLPEAIEASMGVALYAMFIALLVPGISDSKGLSVLVFSTAVVHSVIVSIMTPSGKPSGWSLVASSLVCAFAGTFLIEEKKDVEK